MKRGVTPDSLVIDRPCPTSTRAVNVVSSDIFSQHGDKKEVRTATTRVYTVTRLYLHGLKNVVLGIITYHLRLYSVCKNQQ